MAPSGPVATPIPARGVGIGLLVVQVTVAPGVALARGSGARSADALTPTTRRKGTTFALKDSRSFTRTSLMVMATPTMVFKAATAHEDQPPEGYEPLW